MTLPLPPGPKGRALRHFWERLHNNADFFARLQAEYGDIVYLSMPFRKLCVIFDHDLIREALVEKRAAFEQGPGYKRATFLKGPTVLTADGDEHKRRRKLVQPSFHKQALHGYAETMIEETDRLQRDWRDGQTIDLAQTTTATALNIAARAFFGADSGIDPGLVAEALKGIFWDFKLSQLPFNRYLARLPLPQNRQAHAALHALDREINAIIDQALDASQDRNDLISHLVRAKDESGVDSSLNRAEVRDEAYIILMAGHETTANAMAWMFYCLDQHPAVRERLEREIDAVLGGRRPSLADYDRLVYARAVFDEAVRLFPPVYYIGRQATEDCTLGPYRIPKGTALQPCLMAPLRDERFFAGAGDFRPERWLEEGGHPKPALSAFGLGAHKCVGEVFARMEAVFMLAAIVPRWRLSAVSSQPPVADSLVVYKFPQGFQMAVRTRAATTP
jgi:cytochrome P450